ncbi:WD40 repeat - like 10 [Theobroma cacao]|nr:WD40 repeat - like 10 [Theobroma cacao]
MEVDDDNSPSTSSAEPSVAVPDSQTTVPTANNTLLQPVQPIVPAVVPPAVVPPIAPLPAIPPLPVVHPLAPLPIRAPILKSLAPQNGEVKTSDSDSDHEDEGRTAAVDYEISEESRLVRERQEKAMQELLMKRRAAALAVPTNDMAVRTRLRRLGEPITLFGEREMERRDRLRMIMAKLDSEGQLEKLMKAHEEEEAAVSAKTEDIEEDIQYPFYTEGPKELLDARIDIAKYSVVKAAMRVQRAQRKRDDPDEDMDAETDWALRQAGNLVLDCSEIGDDRPLSGCSFSRDGQLLATCSLSGVAKLWSMPRGHTERATDVTFSPVHDHLATASADRTAKLWNTDGSLLTTFEGHLDRLARIAFHPSGKYLGTTSFDKTWRLWDIDSGVELLLQEGHSRSVYGIAFHQDGSLAASCGLDALARVWDLRTGRSVLALEGHVKPVWSGRDFKPVKSLPGHEAKVTASDISEDSRYIVTVSHDRTIKLWTAGNIGKEKDMDLD